MATPDVAEVHAMRVVVVYKPNVLVVQDTTGLVLGGSPPSLLALAGVAPHEWPKPERKPGEVMVRAHSTSVNPVDVGIYKAVYKPAKGYPKVLGGDVAGKVDRDGAGEGSKFKTGDRVIALTPGFFHTVEGTWQDHSSVPENLLARLPDSLPLKTAGGIPLVGLTAWQALHEGDPKPGKRVLVHAAAGGVGHIAVQIAKALGMYVAGTASPKNDDFLTKELGADEAIDYRKPDWEEAYKDNDKKFDIVIDPMGVRGDAIKKSLAVLKVPDGHYSHIMSAGTDEQLLDRIRADHEQGKAPAVSFTFVQPNGQQLQQVLDLMEQGKVKLHVDKVLMLEDALDAIKYVDYGHTKGKVILTMKQEEEQLAPAGGGASST